MNYLSIDIGTTGCKCQLFNDKGEILKYLFSEYDFKVIDGKNYVDVDVIWQLLKGMVKEVSKDFEIDSLGISSIGESFVLLDKNDKVLFYPMIYTDNRGEKQAKDIEKYISKEQIYEISGVMPHPMYSLYKLMYIKDEMPEIIEKADKLLLVCDYFGYILTGQRVIDYALASRTGVFDIKRKSFSKEILDKLGINYELFSLPKPTGSIVGAIKKDIAKELGLKENCQLVLGSHDQICATIGAGVINSNESADGMGTVECITTVFDKIPEDINAGYHGYPIVPFINGLYCTYILNLTSNSIMNWYRKDILHKYTENEKTQFEYLEDRSERITDILVLPYFASSSTPYQDVNSKGAIINLTLDSTDGDIYRAVMESTSYEMKLNFEVVKEYGIKVDSVVATGGGANSKMWVKIKSDIFGLPIKTLRSSEGGLCGLAMIQSVAMGNFETYEKAREVFVQYKDEFLPSDDNKEIYDKKYIKYKKLYKNLKELF